MDKWISVKEKVPKEDVGVLVTNMSDVWSACYFVTPMKIAHWRSHGYSGYDMEQDFSEPTHWMPLPEPPKE